jgi:cell division protease FtsH
MNSTLKPLLKILFLVGMAMLFVFVVVILLWSTFENGRASAKELDYSAFLQAVQTGQVAEVTIKDRQEVSGKLRSGGEFTSQLPFQADSAFRQKLEAAKVVVRGEKTHESPLITILFTWAPVFLIVALPVLLIVTLWSFFMRPPPGRKTSSPGTV